MEERLSDKNPKTRAMAGGTGGGVKSLELGSNGIKIKGAVKKDEDSTSETAPWGINDGWPITARQKIMQSSILSGALPFKRDMLIAGGVACGKMIEGDDGELYFNEVLYKPFEEWKKNFDFNLYLTESALDLICYGSAISQFLIHKNEVKVAALNCSSSRVWNCRLAKQDKKTGHFKFVRISTDYQTTGGIEDNDNKVDIPLIPTTYNPAGWLKDMAAGDNKQFAYRMFIPDLGNSHYPLPFWYSVVDNGWYKNQQLIIALRNQMLENIANIKFQFKIHDDYWEHKFGEEDWKKWNRATQEVKVKEVNDAFADFLSNPKNKEVYLWTGVVDWPDHLAAGKTKDLIEIIPFDIKYPEGVFQQDSAEASTHHLSAVGIHPTVFGANPGSKMGGGGGSENRVAFNQRTILMAPMQNILTRPLDIVRDVNGWDSDLVFRMRNSLISTLDVGEHTAPKVNAAGDTAKKPAE